MTTSVALVTLGCARNEVDSEELAGRLEADGFRLVADPADADTVVVNTCGFVEAAKKDSVDTLLEAADLKDAGRTRAVVAVGCLAERYGKDLADRAARGRRRARLRRLPRHRRPAAVDRGGGDPPAAHPAGPPPAAADQPRPTPDARPDGPGHARGQPPDAGSTGPMAPLKLASGCDRRCTFCAIPSFRGSFVSRRPTDVLDEAPLAGRPGRPRAVPGQRELHVLRQGPRRPAAAGDAAARAGRRRRHRAGAGVLPPARRDPARAGRGDRHARPASRRTSTSPSSTPAPRCSAGCAASATPRASWACSTGSGALAPEAGVRSNVIVGFPGETEDDLETLCDFLVAARHGRHRRLRLLRRGRHRGGDVRRQARRRRDPRPRRSTSPRWSRSSPRSAPRSASARPSRSWSRSLDATRTSRAGRPPGPRGRRHDLPAGARPTSPSATWSPRRGRRHRRRRPGGPTTRERRHERAAGDRQTSNWNLPNVLTDLRIVMVPFFGWALLHDGGDSIAWRLRRLRAVRRSR